MNGVRGSFSGATAAMTIDADSVLPSTGRVPLRIILGVPGGMMLMLIVIQLATDLRVSEMLRDPAGLQTEGFWVGILSHAGVVLWLVTAMVTLAGAATLRRRTGPASVRRFLAMGGTITLVFALDDYFLLHEHVVPALTGIPEVVVLAAYALATIAYILSFRNVIARMDARLFLIAIALLGTSLMLDVIELIAASVSSATPATGVVDVFILVEDGAKFAGILGWNVFYVRSSLSWLPPPSRSTGSSCRAGV